MNEFVIWWLSQEACEQAVALGAEQAEWPTYIMTDLRTLVLRACANANRS